MSRRFFACYGGRAEAEEAEEQEEQEVVAAAASAEEEEEQRGYRIKPILNQNKKRSFMCDLCRGILMT